MTYPSYSNPNAATSTNDFGNTDDDLSLLPLPGGEGRGEGERPHRHSFAPGTLAAWTEYFLNDTGYIADLRRSEKEVEAGDNRVRNLKDFIATMDQSGSPTAPLHERLTDFLENVTLDSDREDEEDKAGDAVTLITMHSCKGLEFPHVYVIGLEDGLLPHTRSKVEGTLDEERRLFYVAVTRARRHLLLTWSRSRQPGGRATRQPSRFLDALAAESGGDGVAPRSSVRRGRGSRPATRREPASCRSCGRSLVTGAERARMRCRTCPPTASEVTVDLLRTWRLERAREREVPAYVIFTDATMEALAEALPRDTDELLAISGIGPDKIDRYGDLLLALLAEAREASAETP